MVDNIVHRDSVCKLQNMVFAHQVLCSVTQLITNKQTLYSETQSAVSKNPKDMTTCHTPSNVHI